MFFDKLWVRIKGDLLIMKDDLAAGENLRERAAILLARLEDLLGNRESEGGEGIQEDHAEGSAQDKSESTRTLASGGSGDHALQDIHREWEELVKLREKKQEDSKDSQIPRPNPRSLG
jgi:hypothetical protein